MNKAFTLVELMIVVMIVGLVGCMIVVMGISLVGLTQEDHVQFHVKRVTEISRGDQGAQYLVFTKEGEVFENEDDLFHGKWNSSDYQGRLDPGQCYNATVVGYRIPVLSMYRNIISLSTCTDGGVSPVKSPTSVVIE